MNKLFAVLSVLAYLVLVGVALWFGALNQDEGWYLYAARLVDEGQMPYRDFFFTQGPFLPYVYAAFGSVWKTFGLLGARSFTAILGLFALLFATGLARLLVPPGRRTTAALMTFMLLGTNLYHLYYTTIPKTYALGSLLLLSGSYVLALALTTSFPKVLSRLLLLVAGVAMGCAAGVRTSLVFVPFIMGVALLLTWRRHGLAWLAFGLGALLAGTVVYGPFLFSDAAREGLLAANSYHMEREGSSIVWLVGSLSRLVRWYAPIFICFGLALSFPSRNHLSSEKTDDVKSEREFMLRSLFFSFLVVWGVQMLAPFPYEDYHVPLMPFLALVTVSLFVNHLPDRINQWRALLLVLGLTWCMAFSSPLLQEWMTNGQDRLWTRKREQSALAHLRTVAQDIEALDPHGTELLTQDLYLAIETGRKVPKGLEMGPFSRLTDDEWVQLLDHPTAPIAALSGYSFAIEVPSCRERDFDTQMKYWQLVSKHYDRVACVENFGQNSTPLMILRRKVEQANDGK